jgi:hypothetical protein
MDIWPIDEPIASILRNNAHLARGAAKKIAGYFS